MHISVIHDTDCYHLLLVAVILSFRKKLWIILFLYSVCLLENKISLHLYWEVMCRLFPGNISYSLLCTLVRRLRLLVPGSNNTNFFYVLDATSSALLTAH